MNNNGDDKHIINWKMRINWKVINKTVFSTKRIIWNFRIKVLLNHQIFLNEKPK